jgi:hypothetical protein
MTVTIGRRELLAALGGAAAAWPLAAETGYVEGQNVATEYRWAEERTCGFESGLRCERRAGYEERESAPYEIFGNHGVTVSAKT